jgi:hypothetical protein
MINREFFKKVFYVFFSAVFLIVSVGIVVWIIKQEIEKGSIDNQKQMADEGVKNENANTGDSGNAERDYTKIESSDDASRALSEIDSLMENASGEKFEND